jgi:hypothetical protein
MIEIPRTSGSEVEALRVCFSRGLKLEETRSKSGWRRERTQPNETKDAADWKSRRPPIQGSLAYGARPLGNLISLETPCFVESLRHRADHSGKGK